MSYAFNQFIKHASGAPHAGNVSVFCDKECYRIGKDMHQPICRLIMSAQAQYEQDRTLSKLLKQVVKNVPWLTLFIQTQCIVFRFEREVKQAKLKQLKHFRLNKGPDSYPLVSVEFISAISFAVEHNIESCASGLIVQCPFFVIGDEDNKRIRMVHSLTYSTYTGSN